MEKILVTGVSGFVGSALVRDLKKEPSTLVVTIRRDLSRAEDMVEDYCVRGDVTNYDIIRRAIADYEIDAIYHLASQSIVRICAADPMSAYNTNVMGTVNILEAARTCRSQVKSIVVSTSDKAFGHSEPPYSEHTPLTPKYTYEATKACQDFVAQNYFHNYGLPVKVARFSNIYGPADPNWSRLIPNSIRRILSGKPPIIYTSVAEYVREFIYIDDAVSAFKTVAEVGNPGEVYCVGGGIVFEIQELVENILRLCESDLKIEYIEKIATFKEVQKQYLDSSKIKALGWSPKTSLEQGIKNTIDYYKANLNQDKAPPSFGFVPSKK